MRAMVMNRLSDPRSKLGLLRWLEQLDLPGVDQESVQHQHLVRAMEVLLEHKEEIENELVETLLPLFDTEMDVTSPPFRQRASASSTVISGSTANRRPLGAHA